MLNDTQTAPAFHQNPATYAFGSELSFTAPVRSGYVFEGWYLDEEFTEKIEGITTTDKGNKTVYAKWSPAPVVQQPNGTNETNSSNSVEEKDTQKTVLKKVKGLKVKKMKKNCLKISWKRDKNVTGYQIAIKTGGKGKYKIVKTIKKNKTIRFIKKNLKKGKKYFVKVRVYKIVAGKKVYGTYSKVKKIRFR